MESFFIYRDECYLTLYLTFEMRLVFRLGKMRFETGHRDLINRSASSVEPKTR